MAGQTAQFGEQYTSLSSDRHSVPEITQALAEHKRLVQRAIRRHLRLIDCSSLRVTILIRPHPPQTGKMLPLLPLSPTDHYSLRIQCSWKTSSVPFNPQPSSGPPYILGLPPLVSPPLAPRAPQLPRYPALLVLLTSIRTCTILRLPSTER